MNNTTDESIRSEEPPHGRLLPRGTSSARILAAVFLSVMVALSGYTYWNDFQVATSRSADLMQALTKAADEQINGSLRTIDLLLQHVGNYLAASDVEEPRAIYQALHLQARAFPEVRSLFVADSSGMLRGDPDGQRSVAHRAYFRLQAQLFRLNQVVIDGPHVEDEGDEPQIILSRPITASDGSFKGIVGAVLSTSFFSDPLKLVGLDGEGTAMLLNTNGVVLARFPASQEWVGRSLAQTRLMAREMTHHPDGVFRSQGDMGSIDQVISYRLLENYPLVVATGIPMEGISSRWWETTRLKVAIELALAVILFMLAHNLDGRER
ncbi:MAG: hypothetical protein K2Q10_00050, partial [Rhodospirillales bacterium]|nr:hypothetical protein [Rhodospirillales bacterium]